MAGRGCTITIKFLGGSTSQGRVEDISLPVALHSPLMVLKEQLHSLVLIAPNDQVLILCDLTDPERNSDVLLIGRDHLPLKDCGIRHGSVLTLHALGMSAEKQQKMMASAFEAQLMEDQSSIPIYVLETAISAAEANHSYNGVIFDVEICGPFEIDIVSLSVAGMLGRVRIFARNSRWEDERPQRQNNHWWAHQDSVSREGWEVVADVTCRPSWDKPLEIKFDKVVKLLPHQRRALYCHSSLPDDLGIQYQSYRKNDIIAQDQFIVLHPGLGHTGSEPFDDHQGWYRSYRGPAGSVQYHARWKGWSPFEHLIFPKPLRTAVITMLLCNFRETENRLLLESTATAAASSEIIEYSRCFALSSLPKDIIYYILEFMHFDWFIDCQEAIDRDRIAVDEEVLAATSKKNAATRFLRMISGELGGAVHLGHLFSYLSQHSIEFEGETLALTDLMEALQSNGHSDEDDDDYDSDQDPDQGGFGGYWEVEEDEVDDDDESNEDHDDDDEDESSDDAEEEMDLMGNSESESEGDEDNGIFGRSYYGEEGEEDEEDVDSESQSDKDDLDEVMSIDDDDDEPEEDDS